MVGTLNVTLPALHARQQEVADSPARFRVLACGRRWGKTRLGSALCLTTALKGGRAWWVAPSYPTAMVGWRLIHRMGLQIPGAEIRQVDRMVSLPGGGEVRVRSADNPDSLRGEGLDFVVIDECAMVREAAWVEAIRPALSDRRGRGMFISTPKGHNWFWRLWQRCMDGEDADWHGWQLPTTDNPYIDPAEVEAARLDMNEDTFSQEYLAQFIDDAGGVFRGVAGVSTGQVQEPEPGAQYVMGIDWAFSNDYTVVSVMRIDGTQVYIDRYNNVDYSMQRERIAALCQRYPPAVVISENNAMGQPNNEELVARGIPVQMFTTTSASKAAIIQALAGAIERQQVTLLDDPVQIGELQAYEGKRGLGGLVKYSAPDGMHDDTVMALALAYSGISKGGMFA